MRRKNFFISLIVALILLTGIDTWAAAPTIQAKLISWTGLSTTQIKLKWVNGNGANRVVVMKQASAINATPLTDNTTYSAGGNVFAAGTLVDGSAYVVYNGSANNVTVTGLSQGVTYYVQVYEYNGAPGAEEYYQVTNTNNPRNFTTPSTAATAPTSISVAAVTGTSFDLTWGGATNQQGYYVWLAANAAFTTYGGVLDDYNAADIGNTTQFTFDGLTQNNTNYFFKVASYNNSSTSSSATYTANNNNGQVSPLANEPSVGSMTISASIPQTSGNSASMTLNWGGATANSSGTIRYVVLGQAGAAVTETPFDGGNYSTTATANFTSAPSMSSTSKILYEGVGTSVDIFNLTPNTQYTFAVFASQTNNIANNGNFSDRNFNLTGTSVTRYTIAAEQTTQPSSTTFSSLSKAGTGYVLSWTDASSTATTLKYAVVAKAGSSSATSTPTDGTYPTDLAGNFTAAGDATTNLSDGKIIYMGTSRTLSISNLSPETQYTFAIYAANEGSNGNTTINFNTASPLTGTRYTLKAQDPTGVDALTVRNAATETSAVDDKAINVAYDGGATNDNVLVVLKVGAPNAVDPTDGTTYTTPTSGVSNVGGNVTVATTLGVPAGTYTETSAGNYVVYAGSSTITSIQIGGLAPNTRYQVLVSQYESGAATTENYNTSATYDIYSISQTPTSQVTTLSATSFNSGTIIIGWTNGLSAPSNNSLITMRSGASAIINQPVDGTSYTADSDFSGVGTSLTNNTKVVVEALATTGSNSATLTGLTPSTLYTINGYSFRDDNSNGMNDESQANYRITSPQSITRFTLANAQPDGAAALTFSNVSSSSMSVVVGGATAVNTTKYLVVATPGGTPNTTQVVSGRANYAGTSNTATSVDYSTITQLYSPNNVDQSGAFVLYDGAAATLNVTGLSAKTQYSYTVWTYNTTDPSGATSSNNDKNFFATATTASRFTLATEPTAQAGSTTITSPTTATLTYSIGTGANAGSGNTLGYLSTITSSTLSETVPVDGTNYTANTSATIGATLGSGAVIYDGATAPTSATIFDLTPGTEYTIRTYAYAWDGTNSQTKNYLTSSSSSASKYTLATQPNNMSLIGAALTRTSTTATLQWNDDGTPGTGSLISIAQSTNASAVTVADAVDGTSYASATASHAWNSDLLSGSTYVAYNGPSGGTQQIAITGLSPNKRYDVEGVHYNGVRGTGAENYSAATVTNNFFTLATEPTVTATNFAAGVTANTETAINLSWTASTFSPADGSNVKYLIIGKTGATPPSDMPTDGTDLTVTDNNFGTDQIISTAGEQLVYKGTGTSVTVSGLTGQTQYIFALYTYTEGIDPTTVNYNTTASSVIRFTLSPAPTTQPTSLVFSSANYNSSATTSGVTLTWSEGDGGNELITVATTDANTAPTDGSGYTSTANVDYGSSATLGNAKVVYYGPSNTVAVTGLTPATTYVFTGYSFNRLTDDQTSNYNITSPATATVTTLARDPLTSATITSVSNIAWGSYRLNWTGGSVPAGGTLGYLVTATSGAVLPSVAPSDGVGYSYDTDPDDGSNTFTSINPDEIVYQGTATSVDLTGLADATIYTFKVYVYNWNGSNISSRNYEATGSTTFSRISVNSAPVVQATSAVGARTTSSIALTYNYPNGTASPNNTLVSITPASASTTDPSIGVHYGSLTSGSTTATNGGTQLSSSSSTVVSSTGYMNSSYPTSLTISGLTANTQYRVDTYAAAITDNTLGNSNTDANYLTPSNTFTAYTLQTAPNAPTAALYTNLNSTSYTLSWAAPTGGADGYVVLAKQGSSLSTGVGNEPAGGTQYSDPANTAFGGNAFGGNELMYVGSSNTVTISGLTAKTQYSFAVYAYSNGALAAQTINYGTPLTTSRYTLATAPTAAPTLSGPIKGTNSLTFTAASGAGGADKVLVYALKGSSSPATTPTTAAPSDGSAGTVVAGSSVLNTGTGVLVYDGNFGSATVTLSSLDQGTYYSFVAYAYNSNSINSESNAYFGTASAVLSTNTLASEPTVQAGSATLTARTATTANYTISNGDGIASLVSTQLASNNFTDAPVDGLDYTGSTTFGSGTTLGNSINVSKTGIATTGTLSGLTAATQYALKSYAYNGTGTGQANYLTTSPGSTTFRTLATAPTSQPGSITFGSAVYNATSNTSGYTVTWSPASGTTANTKYIVVGKTTASNFVPTNGTAYTTSSDISPEGTIYYVGSALSVPVVGLTPNTSYTWKIYAYDDGGFAGSENYFGTASTNNQTTIPTDPLVFSNSSTITKTLVTDQSIELSWNSATQTESNATTVTGYLVVAKQGAPGSISFVPTDGTNYATASDFAGTGVDLGSGEYVVYKSTGTSATVTGLTSGLTYDFKVFSYTQGTPGYSANFSGNSSVTAPNVTSLSNNFSVLAAPPGSTPSAMQVASRTNNTIHTTWSGTGAANTLLSQKTTAFVTVTDDPVNGTGYTAPVAIGGASASYTGVNKTSHTFTSLTPDTKYFFRVYDYNGSGATSNYGTSGSNFSGTFGYTLANEPSTQVVLSTASATQNGTSLVIPYTYGGTVGDKAVVLYKTGADITTAPSDGTRYANPTTIDGATVSQTFTLAASGNITVTGLTQNTSYYIAAFAFAGDYYSADAISTDNYVSTIGTNKVQLSTIASEPSAITGVSISNRTNTAHTVSWSQPDGLSTLLIGSTSSTPPTIMDGLDYSSGANLTYASATIIQTNYRVLYSGSATTTRNVVLPTQAATQYYYYVYAFNGSGGSQNYTSGTFGTHYTLETAPTAASTGLGAGSTNAGGSVSLTWTTADDNAKTLLLRRNDGSNPTAPTSGVNYSSTIDVNTTIATDLAAGSTDAKSFTVTGLTPGTTYRFDAYAYRGGSVTGTTPDAGNEGTNNYTAGSGTISVIARSAEPAGQATSLAATTVGANTASLTWTAASGGATRYLVVVAENADVINAAPLDGNKYAAAVNYAGNESNSFGSGFTSTYFTGLGNATVVYNGTGTTVAIPGGLASGQTYKAAVFAFNEATTVGSENYVATISALNAVSSNYISFTTLSNEPTQAVTIGSVTSTGTSITIPYTKGGGSGSSRVVFYQTNSDPTFVPVDGATYTDGDTYSGAKALNTSSNTTVTISGLTSGTTYYYRIYEYNGSGSTANYLPSPYASGNQATGSAPVLTSLAFTSGTLTSYGAGTSSITVELRDASNAAFTENAAPRAITLKFSYNNGTSTTVTMGTVNTTNGLTNVTFTNINLSNTITNTNGTLNGTLWAEATSITRAKHGNDNISVVATEPTAIPVISIARQLSPTKKLTVSVDYNPNSPSVLNTGYLLYTQKTTDVGTPYSSLVDGTTVTADGTSLDTPAERLSYIGVNSPQVYDNLTGGTYYFKAIPYRGTATNATVNYGQLLVNANSRSCKEAQYNEDFDENSLVENDFNLSELNQNPVTDKAMLNLHSFTNQVFNVEVVGATGEKIVTIMSNVALGRGRHNLVIPIDEKLASGTYYIIVSSGANMVMKPFVIVK